MTTPTVTETRPRVPIGERVELVRYHVSAGERILYGQRINGVVRVTDRPANGKGRSYLVERELEQEGTGAKAAMHALIDDYLAQARMLDAAPMSRSVLGQYLAALSD
jgi:hypothetical protein